MDYMWDQNDSQIANFWPFLFSSWLKWDCGVSTGDGKFPELQNISINKYEAEKT